jgi:hypothetical protein
MVRDCQANYPLLQISSVSDAPFRRMWIRNTDD